MSADEEAKARKLYEEHAASWVSAFPWAELSHETRRFWLREAMKREGHSAVTESKERT